LRRIISVSLCVLNEFMRIRGTSTLYAELRCYRGQGRQRGRKTEMLMWVSSASKKKKKKKDLKFSDTERKKIREQRCFKRKF
jgi:hypothetical protein